MTLSNTLYATKTFEDLFWTLKAWNRFFRQLKIFSWLWNPLNWCMLLHLRNKGIRISIASFMHSLKKHFTYGLFKHHSTIWNRQNRSILKSFKTCKWWIVAVSDTVLYEALENLLSFETIYTSNKLWLFQFNIYLFKN